MAEASKKARMAKRVIEVLEFFDEAHPQATVMDIARRYQRPQSSTSELLSNLVSLGLLYKDRHARVYSPTPRAALLGSLVQPSLVRDGKLVRLMDRLSLQTGLSVAAIGMVGLDAQVFAWRSGGAQGHEAVGLRNGERQPLSESAAGWMLLSTVAQARRDGMIRRMHAEAPAERGFSIPAVSARVKAALEMGHATGAAGFDAEAEMTAVLVPDMTEERAMAIAFAYRASDQIDPQMLVQSLREAIARGEGEEAPAARVQALSNAA